MRSIGSMSPLISTLFVVIIVTVIGVFITVGQNSAKQSIINTSITESEQILNQVILLFETMLEEGHEDISLIVEYIEKENISRDSVVDFFNTQSHIGEFESIFYVDLDGNGINKEGQIYDFSNDESFLNSLGKNIYISSPKVVTEHNEMLFDILLPVCNNDSPVAMLYGQIMIGELLELVESNTKGTGDMFIVDTSLQVLFSADEKYIGLNGVLDSEALGLDNESVLQARSSFIEGNAGSFFYNCFGKDKVLAFSPVVMTDWALVVNVEASALTNELAQASSQLNFITTIVYWGFVILLIFIVTYVKRSTKLLEKKAYYDDLTGLPNLTKFQIEVQKVLVQTPDKRYIMQKMDIAKFGAINQLYGIKMGDTVLRKISEVMLHISKNIEKTFICARIGVDEFIMFAGNGYLDHIEASQSFGENEFKKLVPELKNYEFLFRYGRYYIETGETDVMNIIGKTTIAHNMARANSHQSVWDYNDKYRKEICVQTEVNNKRKEALAKNDFKVFLQPKFSTIDEKLIGAETLVRWIEEDGTIIYPDVFIPLFEKNGFIVELDNYMLKNVCILIRRWLDSGFSPPTISVNYSRLNLSMPDFVQKIVATVDTYNVPHEYIEIELTESTTIDNDTVIEKLFHDLHEHGFKISIDDFGAGASSLGMLKNLQADTLKLDKAFFSNTEIHKRDDMLLDGIITMAHNLDMYVVAEGIETREQVDMLRTINCDAIQGYFFAKPMPTADFEEKYKNDMVAQSTK